MNRRAFIAFVVVPLGVLFVAGTVGVALSPYLLVEGPLLLIALSPLVRHLVVVSPMVEAVPFFGIAVLRLFLADPFVYALGARLGPRAIEWLESRSLTAGRVVRWLEKLFARAGYVALFVNPGITVCTLAGVVRMPLVPFVVIDLAGTVTLVVLIRFLGDAFRDWIVLLVGFVQEHVATLTTTSLAVVALVGTLYFRRRWRADLVGVRRLMGDDQEDG